MNAQERVSLSPIKSVRSAVLVSLGVGLILGVCLLGLDVRIVSAAMVAVILVVAILVKPEIGLLLWLVLEYLRPMERYPFLDALHLPRLIAGGALVAWLLSRRAGRGEPLVRDPQNAAMLVFLVIMASSMAQAYWRGIALVFVVGFIKGLAIYLLITNLLNSERRLVGFVWVFLGVNAWLAVEQSIHYHVGSMQWSGQAARVGAEGVSLFGDSNDFAMAVLVALPFAYFLAWHERAWWRRGILIAMVGLFLASIVFTGSRGGAIGLIAVALALWVKSPRRLVGFGLVGVLVCGWWLLAPPEYRDRVMSVRSYHSDETAQLRMQYWAVARAMWRDRPLLGYGPANFGAVMAELYTPENPGRDYHTVHSTYYQALAEMGTLGFIGFMLLVGCLVRDTVVARRHLARAGKRQSKVGGISDALDTSLFGFMVSGIFLSALYHPHLYVLAAIAVATCNVSRRIAEGVAERGGAKPDGELVVGELGEAAPA